MGGWAERDASVRLRLVVVGLGSRCVVRRTSSHIQITTQVGSELLLIDEDTSATNLLVRDEKMMMLVAKDKEPITPFLAKAEALHKDLGVSTIMVMGGSGDYFEVADLVVMLDAYQCLDKTAEAKDIARQFSTDGSALALARGQPFGALSRRVLQAGPLQTAGKVVARGKEKIQYGDHDIDLGAVEQLVEVGQTRAIGAAMRLLGNKIGQGGQASVRELVEMLEATMDSAVDGMDALEPNMAAVGNMARPRKFELAAAINRFRPLVVTSQPMR
jgi:predicted ABC-class ATPase